MTVDDPVPYDGGMSDAAGSPPSTPSSGRPVPAPPAGDDWLGCVDGPLPLDAVPAWVVRPDCGASVVFTGTARDHAEGRPGVTALEYEAWPDQVLVTLERLVADVRSRWPDVGRLVLLHRTGRLAVGDAAVVVAVAAPHRDAAFDAARFAIDSLKAAAPIWKREEWAGGSDWGLGAVPPVRAAGSIGATMGEQ